MPSDRAPAKSGSVALSLDLLEEGTRRLTWLAAAFVVIAIGLYVPALPFAALAWIEADAPADDDER